MPGLFFLDFVSLRAFPVATWLKPLLKDFRIVLSLYIHICSLKICLDCLPYNLLYLEFFPVGSEVYRPLCLASLANLRYKDQFFLTYLPPHLLLSLLIFFAIDFDA